MEKYISVNDALYKYNNSLNEYTRHALKKNNFVFNMNKKIYVNVNDSYKRLIDSDYENNILYYKDEYYQIIMHQSNIIYVNDNSNNNEYYIELSKHYDSYPIERIPFEEIKRYNIDRYTIRDIFDESIYIKINKKDNCIEFEYPFSLCLECSKIYEETGFDDSCGKNDCLADRTLIPSSLILTYYDFKSYIPYYLPHTETQFEQHDLKETKFMMKKKDMTDTKDMNTA